MDNGTCLNFFIWPDLDIGLDDCSFLYDGFIANHRALKHDRFAFDTGRRAYDGSAQFGSLTYIGIVPDNAAINLRPLINDTILTNRAWTMNDRAAFDPAIVRQVDRSIQLRILCNLSPFLTPDVATNILR